MNYINLTNNLYMEKMNGLNESHLELAKELDKDECICGENGYLWSIEKNLSCSLYVDGKYLNNGNIYQSPYVIYHNEIPIGYMEISKIYEDIKAVALAYALLNIYRGKGYAYLTLKSIAEKILLDKVDDVQRVMLHIDVTNIKSQNVALRAGFADDGLSLNEYEAQGYIGYQKTRGMLIQEKHFM